MLIEPKNGMEIVGGKVSENEELSVKVIGMKDREIGRYGDKEGRADRS